MNHLRNKVNKAELLNVTPLLLRFFLKNKVFEILRKPYFHWATLVALVKSPHPFTLLIIQSKKRIKAIAANDIEL